MDEPAKLKLDGDTGSPDPKTGVAAADALLTPYREEDRSRAMSRDRRWNSERQRWEYPVIDHIDGNPANNDLANLRKVWPTEHVGGAVSDLAPLTYVNDAPAVESRAVTLPASTWRLIESHAMRRGLDANTALLHLVNLGLNEESQGRKR